MNLMNRYPRLKSGHLLIDSKNTDLSQLLKYRNNYEKVVGWIGKLPVMLFKSTRKFEQEAEIFASVFADQIGQKCIDVYPAVIDIKDTNFVDKINYYKYSSRGRNNPTKLVGIISPDYVSNRTKTSTFTVSKLLLLRDVTSGPTGVFMYEHVLEGLDIYVQTLQNAGKTVEIDKQQVERDLLKIMIFDYFTLQQDRAPINIEISMSETGKNSAKLEVSPVFDNSDSFLLNDNITGRWEVCSRNTPDAKKEAQFKVAKELKDRLSTVRYKFGFIDSATALDHRNRVKANDINLTKLANKIVDDKYLSEYVTQIMLTEPEEVLANIEDKLPGYQFSEKTAQIIEFLMQHQKKTLDNKINQVKQERKEQDQENTLSKKK